MFIFLRHFDNIIERFTMELDPDSRPDSPVNSIPGKEDTISIQVNIYNKIHFIRLIVKPDLFKPNAYENGKCEIPICTCYLLYEISIC